MLPVPSANRTPASKRDLAMSRIRSAYLRSLPAPCLPRSSKTACRQRHAPKGISRSGPWMNGATGLASVARVAAAEDWPPARRGQTLSGPDPSAAGLPAGDRRILMLPGSGAGRRLAISFVNPGPDSLRVSSFEILGAYDFDCTLPGSRSRPPSTTHSTRDRTGCSR